MKLFSMMVGLVLLALTAPTTFAAVSVKTATTSYTGEEIIRMTTMQVTIRKGAIEIPIPVNEILWIRYSNESSLMPKVREFSMSGRYEDAIERLGRIRVNTGENSYETQEVEFYSAFCRAQMALGGSIKRTVGVKALGAFISKRPNNYHVLKCRELLGRLEVALGHYKEAEEHYLALVNTNWPDYKIQAYTAVGESAVAQGNLAKAKGDASAAQEKFARAQSMFNRALKIEAADERSAQNKHVARIGVARCLAESGDVAGGIAAINAVIKKVGPEARMLLPRAYLALGYCYKMDNKPKQAVLQFLMVDLIYNAHRASHAEALKNLVGLWEVTKNIENTRRAKRRLKQLYPGVG